MSDQPVLKVTLDMPPKPVNRLIGALQSAGRKCPACDKPKKMWAVVRPDTRKGRDYKPWRRLLEDRLRLEWWGQKRINGPIRVTMTFVLPRPQQRPIEPKTVKRKTRDGVELKVPNPRREGGNFFVRPEDWKRGQRIPCPRKPDLDRLTNAIFDALTEVGVWWDDAQVASTRLDKWYAAVGEEPSIRLRVEAM